MKPEISRVEGVPSKIPIKTSNSAKCHHRRKRSLKSQRDCVSREKAKLVESQKLLKKKEASLEAKEKRLEELFLRQRDAAALANLPTRQPYFPPAAVAQRQNFFDGLFGRNNILKISCSDLNVLESHCLGEGSFGAVFPAFFGPNMVAVKRFSEKTTVDDVIREAQVLGICPFGPKLIGVTENNELVMELLCRSSSFRRFRLGSLEFPYPHSVTLHTFFQDKTHGGKDDQKLLFVSEIFKAIDFLHKNSILYCDLKSNNVLIKYSVWNQPISAVLADFGLCLPGNSELFISRAKDQVDDERKRKTRPHLDPRDHSQMMTGKITHICKC